MKDVRQARPFGDRATAAVGRTPSRGTDACDVIGRSSPRMEPRTDARSCCSGPRGFGVQENLFPLCRP